MDRKIDLALFQNVSRRIFDDVFQLDDFSRAPNELFAAYLIRNRTHEKRRQFVSAGSGNLNVMSSHRFSRCLYVRKQYATVSYIA